MDHCARWLVTRRSLPFSWAWVLPLLCGADAAIAAAARLPDFSWDKLPLYVHVRKAEAFSARELEHLATFPLITLEKTTGMKSSGSTDVGTLVAATAIKRLNPRAKVLFYRNVLVHYPGYSFDRRLDQIGQPFLTDSRNRSQLVRGKVEAYDLTVPAVVDWWVETAAEMCRHEAIDGLFLDGNVKVLSPYLENRLPAGRKDALIAGYHSMMQRVRAALPENDLMIANLLRARFADGGLGELAQFDGSYLEAFDVPVGDVSRAEYVAKGVESVQRAARAGKIIALTLGLGESGADADRIDDARARLHRFPQYDRPLGPPKGPARRAGLVFTREFEHLSVKVDLEQEQAELRWHENAVAPATEVSPDWDAMRRDVLALKDLTEAPVVHEAEGNPEAAGMRRIYFDGLPFRGRPTRVFAWLGMPGPDRSRATNVPGVVLVHGGGGTAFKEWVQKWNEKGFAAISIAVEGQTDDRTPGLPGAERSGWRSHPWAGPARVGIYGDSEEPLAEQWMYHAVADTVLANSLLRSLPGVDARRVGLMGVSWGGIGWTPRFSPKQMRQFPLVSVCLCSAFSSQGSAGGRA